MAFFILSSMKSMGIPFSFSSSPSARNSSSLPWGSAAFFLRTIL